MRFKILCIARFYCVIQKSLIKNVWSIYDRKENVLGLHIHIVTRFKSTVTSPLSYFINNSFAICLCGINALMLYDLFYSYKFLYSKEKLR